MIRDNPNTLGPDSNYLRYTGEDHVVLGGTSGNDIIYSSEGDDTIWGDAGNDRLDGGYGNDQIRGGAGDDIITDLGGDDNIQGLDGNDVIHGGNGINLIIGGFGQDFIVTGEDANESFGGQGNDFIFGTKADEQNMGNEGDDWIEHGTSDGAPGDNFDPLGNDPIAGNDVYIGSGEMDKFNAEGGDDIMVGSAGTGDRYIGASGFDWATFKNDTLGVTIDISDRFFDQPVVPGSGASVLTRFDAVEGLSGSAHADALSGDDSDAAAIAGAGARGSVLTNIALIHGLQEFLDDAYRVQLGDDPLVLPAGVFANEAATHITAFHSGNIILGGGGGDILEGRGGDDIIDGDAWLNVRIEVTGTIDPDTGLPYTFDSMEPMIPHMLSGRWNPGQLQIVREILTSDDGSFDTAKFSGALFDADGVAQYEIAINGEVQDLAPDSSFDLDATDIVTVRDILGTDGFDTLKHIERLKFSDQTIILKAEANEEPEGLATISGTPNEDQILTASIAGVTDADNITALNPTGEIRTPVAFFWQVETVPGSEVFDDLLTDFTAGEVARVEGPTFTPTDAEVGLRLRVRAVYKDANGVLEEVFSDPTAPIGNVNDAPVGTPTISDTTPTEGIEISASTAGIVDADGLTTAVFQFQWQRAATAGGPFSDIIGATAATYTPVQADVLGVLRVVVKFTDDGGTPETVISAATSQVGDHITGDGNANNLSGTPFDDWIQGLGAADVLSGLAGNDLLDGGAAADTMFGGTGNDRLLGGAGNDTLSGDAGSDTLEGGVGNDTYLVDDALDRIIEAAGAGTDTVQTILASFTLPDNVEVLTYTGAGNFTGTGNGTGNTINGAGGADLLSGLGGDDTLNGNVGNDTLDGGEGNDALNGGADNDSLLGGAGVDNLSGGGGDDVLNGGLDNDVLNGGGGSDTASYAGETSNMTIDLVAGTARRNGTLEDTLTSIESAIGGSGNDSMTGSGGANLLDGGAGDDTLIGGGGADTLLGGAGADRFTYVIGGGADSVDGGAGPGTDILSITSNGSNDVLDVIFNGTRLTNFEGGSVTGVESVTADLGGGTDTLNYTGTTADLIVNLTGSASGFTSILNIENVTGGSGNDTLTGSAGSNNLSGGAGNDTLNGNGGTDVMVGGIGDDTYITDGGDTLTENNNAGTDTVVSSVTFTLANNFENLTLAASGGNISGTGNGGNNVITGNDNINTLSGGAGADTLLGGAGNDVLVGGTGVDVLTGGANNDTFDFNAFNESGVGVGNRDLITDFTTGQDVIDLSTLDASSITAGNQAFTFIGLADFTNGNPGAGQLRYLFDGTDTIIQANTNNNAATVEFEIRIAGNHTLVGTDFIL